MWNRKNFKNSNNNKSKKNLQKMLKRGGLKMNEEPRSKPISWLSKPNCRKTNRLKRSANDSSKKLKNKPLRQNEENRLLESKLNLKEKRLRWKQRGKSRQQKNRQKLTENSVRKSWRKLR
jgi:hypothetical protein